MNFAAQASLCTGAVLTIFGVCNMGSMIRFVSHPVMTGFTNAAAMIIAMNQMSSVFGFPSKAVPQVR